MRDVMHSAFVDDLERELKHQREQFWATLTDEERTSYERYLVTEGQKGYTPRDSCNRCPKDYRSLTTG